MMSGLKPTLRLRLTLFYTLLVAIVLAASGVGLHFLLRRNLYQSLDNSLHESVSLLNSLSVDPGEVLKLRDEDGALRLPADLTALLFDADGNLLDNLGPAPQTLPKIVLGFSAWEDWRVYGEVIKGRTLLVMRDVERVRESLQQFNSSFFILAPMAVLLAFVLGYLLAGQALNPVTALTKATYDLAERRAWQEKLPEPKRQDELWQLARGTNTLLNTLASVIESEKRFTADAAHELRTPLTVLQGRLEQALEQNQDPMLKQLLEKSLGASSQLRELIEKLLLLARTESGQGLSKEPLNLNDVVLETAELMRGLFAAKGLELSLDLPASDTNIQGDHVALGLLLRNLLENALKFTPVGQVKVKLYKAQQAELSIEDSGPGISQAALPYIFERFYQAEVKHRQSGSGLGLALAQSIAQWHGGSIEAQNSSAGGAVFTVKLPLYE
jgi:two-component system, OmpR family, sensor kinase